MATKLEIGIFVSILSLIVGGVTVYLINPPEGYQTYYCNDTNTVGYCYELVDSPTYGKNAWCKWNLDNPRNKKRCLTGWELYKGENVTGNIVDLPDYIEYKVNISDKELLNKQGITEIKLPKCQRVSRDYCEVKIINDIHSIKIFNRTEEEINNDIDRVYNWSIGNYVSRLSEREQINQDKELYVNQSYGTEKIISIE